MSLSYTLLAAAPKGNVTLPMRLVESLGNPGLVAAGFGLLAVVLGGAWLIRAWLLATPSAVANDARLLHELSRAHGLSRGDRRLLASVARHYRLEPAVRLFIEPQRLATAAQDLVFASRRNELARLVDRLFSAPAQ